jgi:hypothetical protein
MITLLATISLIGFLFNLLLNDPPDVLRNEWNYEGTKWFILNSLWFIPTFLILIIAGTS